MIDTPYVLSMCFEKAVKAKPNARDKGALFYMRIIKMREIKFRAWDVENQEMIDADSLAFDYYEPLCDQLRDSDEMKFMQFTGFTDINGVEIYEGDLTEKDDDKFVRCGVVSFIHGCWMVASKSGERYFNLHWYLSQAEVIGNIHQHPELLEGDK